MDLSHRRNELEFIQRSQHIQAFETTPLMVDGVVYFTTPASRAIALDAETGKEIWIFDPFSGASGKRRSLQNRGVAYWEGNSPAACGGERGKLDKRIFFVALNGRLFALDPLSGKPCKGFGNKGAVNLREGVADRPEARYEVTSPP